jgi:hypothetical protein
MQDFEQVDNMKKTIKILLVVTLFTLFWGCAARHANLDRNKKISNAQDNVIVFPFRNAYYKGRELVGVGTAISSTFVNEVIGTGRECRLVESEEFGETKVVDTNQACEYAKQQGANVAIIGTVNEWIDGATQWSGKVDVVGVSVFAYDTETCSLITSANGREQGQWFTFVNAPATRFYRTLTKDLVAAMFD